MHNTKRLQNLNTCSKIRR